MTATRSTPTPPLAGEQLARRLEELLHQDRFPPPTGDSRAPFYEWFTFHWAGEEGERRDVTYAELLRDVQRLANALRQLGIGKGDVVGIYLRKIREVVVAMLACARIGAPHNVVFGGFAPEAVRERMEVSDAKALITVEGPGARARPHR
jgi:acyl-coenzyme A synthetase/AMP-(fatty) acid ligase